MGDEVAHVRFRPGPDAAAEHLGDEVVLIHLSTDRLFLLNRTAARIWELLAAGHEVADIEQRLAREFEATRDEVGNDVKNLLDSLERERLVIPND